MFCYFYCRGRFLYICFIRKIYVLKCSLHVRFESSFPLHKMFIDGPESLELFVDYGDVFISCLDSHSDGTHSLQRIPW